nr:hypothetical protein [Herbaspirillum sp. ASV7]
MATTVPQEVIAAQAKLQAPGQGIDSQATPTNLAVGRKTPKGGKKGPQQEAPTVAQRLYPTLPTTGD